MLTKTTRQRSQEVNRVLHGNCAAKQLCPVKDIVDKFADKWSINCILLLGTTEQLRFNELKGGIDGISQRMLAVTLRSLEEDGLVIRKQFAEIPPRVEYSLTVLGQSLFQQLLGLTGWAEKNFREILRARKKFEKKQQAK
ncbi:MAG: transcriptional regulator [Ferruginibacter sp.]|nr:transcriptional regulator [Ferruginibacter sp.]